jgi:predicted amidohydrolase
MASKKIIRASVVQTCTAAYSLADTLDKLEHYTQVAKQEGAQLAVFPEAL